MEELVGTRDPYANTCAVGTAVGRTDIRTFSDGTTEGPVTILINGKDEVSIDGTIDNSIDGVIVGALDGTAVDGAVDGESVMDILFHEQA